MVIDVHEVQQSVCFVELVNYRSTEKNGVTTQSQYNLG